MHAALILLAVAAVLLIVGVAIGKVKVSLTTKASPKGSAAPAGNAGGSAGQPTAIHPPTSAA